MTIAEKITRAKADYDAVYEAGKAQGGGKPTLYGTYTIKEDAMGDNHWTTEILEGKGVNAYFYDPRIKEYVNLEIADFFIGPTNEGVYWKTTFDENGLCFATDLYYEYQEWTSSIRDINDSSIESTPLPDAKGRLITFTEPTVVSEQFYNRFKEIADTSEDIFGEGYDKAFGEVEYLNDELATSLYGGDTGYRGYYDEFWDKYQNNGNRTNYLYGFAGGGWTPQTLKPKYKIEPTGNMGISMFYLCGYANGQDVINFETIADKFDFSQMQNADNLFYSARIENIYADISNATSANSAFNCGYGAAFKNVRLKVSSLLVKANNMFDYASSLVNLIFEDSIISISLNLQWSTKLSKASITSIINALSTTTTGLSVTFSKTAVESAFGSTTSAEWTSLIGTRSNWTISLV
jgi:hypothetical protein